MRKITGKTFCYIISKLFEPYDTVHNCLAAVFSQVDKLLTVKIEPNLQFLGKFCFYDVGRIIKLDFRNIVIPMHVYYKNLSCVILKTDRFTVHSFSLTDLYIKWRELGNSIPPSELTFKIFWKFHRNFILCHQKRLTLHMHF